MSSPAQFQANRANALKSTGPRSPEGKAASARNPLKHGLRSREVVLKGVESVDEFEQLRDSFYLQFSPVGSVETSLVDRMVAAEWRLRRIRRLESSTLLDRLVESGVEDLLEDPHPAEDAEAYEYESAILRQAHHDAIYHLQQLYRFEAQFERSMERCLRQLELLRKSRVLHGGETPPPEPPAEAVSAAPAPNSNEQSQPRAAVAGHPPQPCPHRLTLVPPRPSGPLEKPGFPAKDPSPTVAARNLTEPRV
ncbi:MAG: hypothetical protein ACKV22_01275 [Bryobacteraceae bacterium]